MKPLNGRFHIENDTLIKTSNGQPIPPEEPVFILRGRDRLAKVALLHYYELCVQDGCNDEFLADLRKAIEGFIDFTVVEQGKMKQPGVTRGK